MKNIIVLFIICLVFCSCTKMYKNDLEVSEYICKDHGGILYVDLFLISKTKCKDGYSFGIRDEQRKYYVDSINSTKEK